ncbi:MAG: TerB family tellurite resistance protein [Chlorobium sp.]|nr:TerB family tellurite resistance protein [Chlorobium sp.]
MEIPQLDRSNYLKGLLITARRDNQLAESEITIIKKLAARLGFSSDFFEETISHLLENKYITEEPIKFSNQEIAKSFLEDGLKLALSDEITTEKEMSWLRDTANENGIGESWFNKKFKELQNKSYIIGKSDFALFSII